MLGRLEYGITLSEVVISLVLTCLSPLQVVFLRILPLESLCLGTVHRHSPICRDALPDAPCGVDEGFPYQRCPPKTIWHLKVLRNLCGQVSTEIGVMLSWRDVVARSRNLAVRGSLGQNSGHTKTVRYENDKIA